MWVDAKYEMTAEVRDKVAAILQEHFPKLKIKTKWDRELRKYAIYHNDFKLHFTKKYIEVLGLLEDTFLPDYDIFDISIMPQTKKYFDRMSD